MAFAEVSLEVGAPLGSGGYGFKTTITRNAGDFEKRFARRLEPLFKGNIGQANLRSEMIDHVTTFFNARRGKAQGFRYRFWADYTATATPKDLGDTASTQGVAFLIAPNTYACYKVYSWGGQTCYKRITKLVQGTVSVFSNGNPATGAAINNDTGIITYSGGGTITWKGEFDLPVRFDTDTLPRVLMVLDDSQDPCVDEQGRALFKFESLPIVEIPAESPVFPPAPVAEINRNIDIGFTNSDGSEGFITNIVETGSEFEQTYARRLYPLFSGTLGELFLREEIEYWVCLFNVLRGRLTRFKWKNWADFQAPNVERELLSGGKIQGVTIPATGDGTNTRFQLAKRYLSGGQSTLKPVYKPITTSLYVNGVAVSGANYTVTNGEVVFTTAPATGAVITWAGEFDLSVRFDDDSFTGNFKRLPGDNECEVGVFEVGGLALVEVPVGAFVRATAPPDDIKCPVGTEGLGAIDVAPACNIHYENFEFLGPDGNILYSFTFTTTNPVVPNSAQIYLIEGVWDNRGTIGSFAEANSTPSSFTGTFYNLPGSGPSPRVFNGPEVLIGTGRSVSGTCIEDGQIQSFPDASCAVRLKFVW